FQKDVININTNVKTKEEAIDYMVKNLKEHRFINNEDVVKQAILNREAESTTAIGMNVAIPHAKSDAVKQPTVAVLQNKEGVDWISLDETLPKILFMIVVP
ncbi:PTS mannose transporter subunit IIABC, partial [Pseudomonas aeruginosa]